MKECKACKELKDFSEFRVRKDSKDGFRNICITCEVSQIRIGKVINEIGNTFGKWTVISRAENKEDGSAKWLCKCECGIEKVVAANTLREGKSLSCGCNFTESRKDKRESNSIEKVIFRSYKNGATSRGYKFELTLEDVEILIYSNCHYCGDTPNDIKYYNSSHTGKDMNHFILTNGIDRIDNTLGYSKTNTVTCCKVCNQMKSNLPLEVFTDKISKIYTNYKKD